MTSRARLNARLDPEMERKVAYLRRRTGLGTSDIVRASIEHYYEAVRTGGAKARDILLASGFIASGSGSPDLSEDYKAQLDETFGDKHS
jgi:hypothetical protein